MVTRTYYLPTQRKGYLDTSLVAVRKRAMEHMRRTSKVSMPIYTSKTMKVLVGTVIYDPTDRHLFVWRTTTSRGKDVDTPIFNDGNIYKTKN